LRFLLLQTHATSYYFVKEKRGKPEKPYPLPYVLRNPYRELRTLHEFGFCQRMYAYSTNVKYIVYIVK
jgi:hypothetical protein